MEQLIINCDNEYYALTNYLKKYQKIFIVSSKSLNNLKVGKYIGNLPIEKTYFSDFAPNPTYDSVVLGVKKYREMDAPAILAIGGGSAIDVAKCIKLYAKMDEGKNYLEQEIIPNDIELLALPTTAGTGSEATSFAVIYYKGEKKSVASALILPKVVIFDPSVLETLPLYQRKATMLDALSHAIESYWSVNATDESKKYSLEALTLIIQNMQGYLDNNKVANQNMLKAANIAGKAINISKTTAGHAMCYKLTSLYGISHGHAALLVNASLYPFMIDYANKHKDKNLLKVLENIAKTLGYNLNESKDYFINLLRELELYDININKADIPLLVSSVNTERLGNFPIKLTEADITSLYQTIFDEIERSEKNECIRFS